MARQIYFPSGMVPEPVGIARSRPLPGSMTINAIECDAPDHETGTAHGVFVVNQIPHNLPL